MSFIINDAPELGLSSENRILEVPSLRELTKVVNTLAELECQGAMNIDEHRTFTIIIGSFYGDGKDCIRNFVNKMEYPSKDELRKVLRRAEHEPRFVFTNDNEICNMISNSDPLSRYYAIYLPWA